MGLAREGGSGRGEEGEEGRSRWYTHPERMMLMSNKIGLLSPACHLPATFTRRKFTPQAPDSSRLSFEQGRGASLSLFCTYRNARCNSKVECESSVCFSVIIYALRYLFWCFVCDLAYNAKDNTHAGTHTRTRARKHTGRACAKKERARERGGVDAETNKKRGNHKNKLTLQLKSNKQIEHAKK